MHWFENEIGCFHIFDGGSQQNSRTSFVSVIDEIGNQLAPDGEMRTASEKACRLSRDARPELE